MPGLKRVRVVLLPITLAVSLLSTVPGCGGDSKDPLKASDGTSLKTPSEIQHEAQTKYAALHPEAKVTKPQPATKGPKRARMP
jgi:hypothetical protein